MVCPWEHSLAVALGPTRYRRVKGRKVPTPISCENHFITSYLTRTENPILATPPHKYLLNPENRRNLRDPGVTGRSGVAWLGAR
jgi:hypothetical protein